MFEEYDKIIQQNAILQDLKPEWIKAIIVIESSGNTYAMRFEPLFYDSIKARYKGKYNDTEIISRAISWGLMQVMGEVARELGYGGRFLSGLFVPEVGVKYGCMKFKKQLERYQGDLAKAAAAYNAGTAFIVGGKFKNQEYVDKFNKSLAEIA